MITILIMGLIGGFIGLVTNAIAVFLLFRPFEPIGPFQGLIPKRKAELAASLGRTVEKELIDLSSMIEEMVEELDLDRLKDLVAEKIILALTEELPALIPPSLIANMVHKYIERHGDRLFEDLIGELMTSTDNLSVVSRHVEQNILALDLARVEQLVYEVARTELHFIVWLGGVLGLLIGLIQGLLVIYIL